MTFVGNSPVEFDNITHISPKPSEELASILKNHDIFITGSEKDPCSNSLIEAMHCGLPAIALNSGGHPEIIGRGGELFNDFNSLVNSIKKVAKKYSNYQKSINLPSIDKVAKKYHKFAFKVDSKEKQGDLNLNRINNLV